MQNWAKTLCLKKLLETKDYPIVEDSPKDDYWGWGSDRNGENNLGKLWMELREEYQNKLKVKNSTNQSIK